MADINVRAQLLRQRRFTRDDVSYLYSLAGVERDTISLCVERMLRKLRMENRIIYEGHREGWRVLGERDAKGKGSDDRELRRPKGQAAGLRQPKNERSRF